jgi:hypothetical protein
MSSASAAVDGAAATGRRFAASADGRGFEASAEGSPRGFRGIRRLFLVNNESFQVHPAFLGIDEEQNAGQHHPAGR